MKKKLFLFITCFFLCSSVIIFFSFRNRQSAEITKNGKIIDKNDNENVNVNEKNNENDNDKVNKKEENKDKSKEIKNEEEKKPEEKDNVDRNNENKDNQELPWQFTWKGIVPSLILSFIILQIFKKKIFTRYPDIKKNLKGCCNCTRILLRLLSAFIFFFFHFVVFPSIFAIKKYKNKSYGERFKLAQKSFFSITLKISKIYKTVIAILVILAIIIFVIWVNIPIPSQTQQMQNN